MPAHLAGAFVSAFFLWMAWPGLMSGFSHDDLMNLTFAFRDGWLKVIRGNLLFFSTQFRPLGGLYYLGLYQTFGFEPLPFRMVGIGLIGLNVFLLYRLSKRLTDSGETGILAALSITWHGNLSPLFFGSGNIYDVLAFTFYIAALGYYVSGRSRGVLSARQLLLLGLLHICALNSKELAASLPLVLLLFEACYHWPPALQWRRWIREGGRGVLLTALLSGIYTLGKISGADSLVDQSAYAPRLSVNAYFTATASYLNDLLYKPDAVSVQGAWWYVAILIGFALLLRSRHMLFAASLVLLAPLPVLLITPRGLASHYITLGGLALWIAMGLTELRRRFMQAIRANEWEQRYSQAVLFLLVALQMIRVHVPERKSRIEAIVNEQRPIRQVAASFRKHPEWWSGRKPILVLSDPFAEYQWAPAFIAILVSHDPETRVVRLEDVQQGRGIGPGERGAAVEWRDPDFIAVPWPTAP